MYILAYGSDNGPHFWPKLDQIVGPLFWQHKPKRERERERGLREKEREREREKQRKNRERKKQGETKK